MPDWEQLIPPTRGNLLGGNALRRTDSSGEGRSKIAFLGVYPAATKWRHVKVDSKMLKLPADVEAESFAPGSASGKKFEKHYLKPLDLERSEVMITDLLPYFLANTTVSDERSMADNTRLFEESTRMKTGVKKRPTPEELVTLAREMPGNLERLTHYFQRLAPTLLLTLGTESAAFALGRTFAKAIASVEKLFYAEPVRIRFLGIELDEIHLVHPHLFIKQSEKWMTRHNDWYVRSGNAFVAKVKASAAQFTSVLRREALRQPLL